MDKTHSITLGQFGETPIRSFVTAMYQTFLGREPDDEGLGLYTRELQRGLPLDAILKIFVGSDEFRDRHARLGLIGLAEAGRLDSRGATATDAPLMASGNFPADFMPPGEAGRAYLHRLRSGFLDRYCRGETVLDVGFAGYDNPERRTSLPRAIGIDLDYPGYDGLRLPFDDGSVDTIFASHVLEHIPFEHAVIRDWFRVLRTGGFIVCMVPSQALYEKRRYLPSSFNADHKRMYTPASLLRSFEDSLIVNAYRVRHLAENDRDFDYTLGPDVHSTGAYEIELVIEKINPPVWSLA